MLGTFFPYAITNLILPWLVIGTEVLPDQLASQPLIQLVAQSAKPADKKSADAKAPAEPPLTLKGQAEKLWQTHQLWLILAIIVCGGYLGVLWLWPLWLLKLPSGDIVLPWKGVKLPLGVVRLLKYHDHVLDTWVEQHWQTTKAEFLKLPKVKDRTIHIELPVYLDGQRIESLSGQDLTATFAKSSAVLLITEEGGAGKTSLACQIAQWGLHKKLARHRLLPVLLDTEFSEQKKLPEAVRGLLDPLKLKSQREPITLELVEHLLKSQRILVIVDHFSEMSEASRQAVTPEQADFPAKALVVTSRLNEPFGGISKTVLKPMRIEKTGLFQFLEAYLERQEKRDLFENEDYAEAYSRLSHMAGERNITPLLAKLYAEEMIEQRDRTGTVLSDSVPKLMLSYINKLNETIEKGNKREILAVQKDAKQVAWVCLRRTYRPMTADKEAVLATLSESDELSASAKLAYLENRLGLLQTLDSGDTVRIVLDPLAEYLAAMHLVEYCRDQPGERWEEFLNSIDPLLKQTNDAPERITGFLLAVRDCCKLKRTEAHIPEGVPERLERKAGLDPKALRRKEEERRIRWLILELNSPELEYQIRAAQDLGSRGVTAAAAEQYLLGMVEASNRELAARQAATQALVKLGMSCDSLRNGIAQRFLAWLQKDDDPAVRRSIAEALGVMKVGEAELLGLLNSDDQPLELRQGAARALSLIGAASGQPVPMLMVHLQDELVETQVKSIPVWQEALAEGLLLELVAIPGGEFMMGSPPDEVGRDWYKNAPSHEDTKGLDVEKQHLVTIQPFGMSRYPVTQAQWRAITALPQINRSLDPNPSNFKGDNLPVERVSWHDAVEFCDRLSAHTSKSYRLPSEAEWEYACRAGTTSAFHIGETLDPKLANYDGNYTYGTVDTGLYRQQTTEVGSFGLVNAFGLADMHGNVYEWCLDHWHPSYDNAPSDGSAWITDGDERYRLMRGGSLDVNSVGCRSGIRDRDIAHIRIDNLGFRVVSISLWT